MSRRVLLAGCDVPGWGGAATVRYSMLERMQRDGLDVTSLGFLHEMEEVYCRYVMGETFLNPRALPNVHLARIEDPLTNPQPQARRLIASLAPDIIVAFGVLATLVVRQSAPGVPLVLLTIGSQGIQELIESGAVRDFIHFQRQVGRGVRFEVRSRSPERQAVMNADLILAHSPVVRSAFEHFYPSTLGKILTDTVSVADFVHFEAERFGGLRRAFRERSIDVLFVASHWRRTVKNLPMVRRIASRATSLAIHIVGDCEEPIPGCTHHHTVASREAMYALLGNARVVAVPSLLDAAPGVLFEASAMGCNVVTSPNCGNWQLCHDDLLVHRPTAEEYTERIRLATKRPYTDNRERFLGGHPRMLDAVTLW